MDMLNRDPRPLVPLWIALAIICFSTSWWLTRPKPKGVTPTRHIAAELEFKQFPPTMCWARKPGQKNWSIGIKGEDNIWYLLPTATQP